MSIPCADNNGNIFASKSAYKAMYGTTEGAFELAKNSVDAGILSSITYEPVADNNILPIIVTTAIISSVTTYAILKIRECIKTKQEENVERSIYYGGIQEQLTESQGS